MPNRPGGRHMRRLLNELDQLREQELPEHHAQEEPPKPKTPGLLKPGKRIAGASRRNLLPDPGKAPKRELSPADIYERMPVHLRPLHDQPPHTSNSLPPTRPEPDLKEVVVQYVPAALIVFGVIGAIGGLIILLIVISP